DRDAVLGEARQVDMQRAGEEQQAEETVKHDIREVDLLDERLGAGGHLGMGDAERGDGGRDREPDGGHAERLRQPDGAVVDEAADRDDGEEDAYALEYSHLA